MIKIQVTYESFDGETVTEDLYFHLSTNQLMEMEFSHEAGLGETLQKMIAEQNVQEVLRLFKLIITKSYGTREGGRFNPASEKDAEAFLNSPAFDQMFADFFADPPSVTRFIEGLIPKQVMALAANAGQDVTTSGGPATVTSPAGPVKQDPPWAEREPTQKELVRMSKAELIEVMKRRQNAPTE